MRIKKMYVLSLILAVIIIGIQPYYSVVYARANPQAGDINDDGLVNNKDLTRLFQYLSGWDVNVEKSVVDVNGDGAVNNKDLTRLFQYLSGWEVQIYGGNSDNNDEITVASFEYGESVNGRKLICYSIAPEKYTKTILLEFEIHGFEDEFDHDGQVLVDTANQLISYYSSVDDLNKTRLLIIPSANPDGLLDGTTEMGFGRCNADGIDLNRDFDANYKVNTEKGRNYTPYAFSGKESSALRDLYYAYHPDIVIDFHGWESSLIGDYELKQPFNEELGLRISHSFTSTNANGYFSNWAHQQGSLAMLVEFTSSHSIDLERLQNAINRLIFDQYDNGEVKSDLSILENKSIVLVSPETIMLSESAYISNGDICIIQNVNAQSGICDVIYPSGGSDVFSTGVQQKTVSIPLSKVLGYSAACDIRKITANAVITVYPTSEMKKNGTNWSIDSGDNYYVINEINSKRCVLYYCSSGGHAGYWKIGWIM